MLTPLTMPHPSPCYTPHHATPPCQVRLASYLALAAALDDEGVPGEGLRPLLRAAVAGLREEGTARAQVL